MAASTMQELIFQGRAEGKAEITLAILRKKFMQVPCSVEMTISKMADPVALESLAVHAATCKSLDEFRKELK